MRQPRDRNVMRRFGQPIRNTAPPGFELRGGGHRWEEEGQPSHSLQFGLGEAKYRAARPWCASFAEALDLLRMLVLLLFHDAAGWGFRRV